MTEHDDEGEEAFVLEIHLLCRFAVVEQHFVPGRGLQAADPRINQDQLSTSQTGRGSQD